MFKCCSLVCCWFTCLLCSIMFNSMIPTKYRSSHGLCKSLSGMYVQEENQVCGDGDDNDDDDDISRCVANMWNMSKAQRPAVCTVYIYSIYIYFMCVFVMVVFSCNQDNRWLKQCFLDGGSYSLVSKGLAQLVTQCERKSLASKCPALRNINRRCSIDDVFACALQLVSG
jgi:hypothetical protein